MKIAFNIVLALAVCGWIAILFGAIFSVMAFDAPGSQARWQAWGFVIGMVVLTMLTFAAILAAKMLFRDERVMLAFLLLIAPAGGGAVFLLKRFAD